MKKTFILILFCLPILRGANILKAQDSFTIYPNSQITDSSCTGKFRVTTEAFGTFTQPIFYLLDSTQSSSTGIFENVSAGFHFIYAKDNNGKIAYSQLNLLNYNYPFYAFPTFKTVNCNSLTGDLKISASGVNRPFLFQLDSSAFQTDSLFKNVAIGFHTYKVKDALGCELSGFIKASSNASFQPNYTYNFLGKCNRGNDFRISTTDNNLSFTLNGNAPAGRDSGAYIWRNIFPGTYTLRIENNTGCVRETPINLVARNLQAYFSIVADSCNTDSLVYYRLNVEGGQPPYTYNINGINTNTDSIFRLLQFRTYSVIVTDVNNCTFNGNLKTPNDIQFYADAHFTPNNCGDIKGTLKISFPLKFTNLLRPLSISFDNRPFSSDTVFSNVEINRYITVKAKTKSGCILTTEIYPYSGGKLDIHHNLEITNCVANTGTLKLSPIGGMSPYRFFIDGQEIPVGNSLSGVEASVKNFKPGIYTVKASSADGCDITKQINIKDTLFFNYGYYSSSCGNAVPFTIFKPDLPQKNSIKFNNQLRLNNSNGNFAWENVTAGNYLIQIIDSVGCMRSDTIRLYSTGLKAEAIPLKPICNDSVVLDFRINVINGRPPYIFTINYPDSITSNPIVHLLPGFNAILLLDGGNCRGYLDVNTNTINDSVRLSSSFIPNNCSSNVGKLSLMINDSSVAYPLSISFDGRPFSSDTVFNNVAENRVYEIIVKSKQGCDLKARINTDRYKFSAYYTTGCANRLGRGSINPQVYGGILPYMYTWNGVGTLNFGDVPIGTYNITATDAAGCSVVNTVTVSTCVWAGDTDTSGVVNQNDLLNIGLAYGEIGPKRPFCLPNSSDSCTLWREHIGFDWSKQTPLRVNYKHIDTNGDGIINAADTLAIKRNWSKTRSFAPNEIIVRSGSPNIYVQTTTVRENQWISLPIILGNAANPAEGFYGLGFSINYDPSVIEVSTVNFTYNQSWLGSNSELLGVSQNDNGHLNIGLTKINHTNSSGVGQIGTLNFKLKSGVGSKSLNFSVTSIVAINSDAQVLLVNPQNSGTIISGTEEPAWATHISVYPNPTTGEFYIEAKGIDIQQIMVFDIAGKMIQSYLKPSKDTPLRILPSGTFFLSIQTEKGMIKRKIVKL